MQERLVYMFAFSLGVDVLLDIVEDAITDNFLPFWSYFFLSSLLKPSGICQTCFNFLLELESNFSYLWLLMVNKLFESW